MLEPRHDGAVMIVDTGWDSYEQLAQALHRRGFDVRFVGFGFSKAARLRRKLGAPWADEVADVDELRAYLRARVTPDLVDVITPEHLLGITEATLEECPAASPALRERLKTRLAWTDKYETAQRLLAAGVPCPPVTPVADVVPGDLTYPVIVKGRVGAGGTAVRVVEDAASLAAAVATLPDPTGAYVERFISGRNVGYIGASSPGGTIVQECTYETTREDADSVGAPTGARSLDAPELRELGRRVLESLGSSSFVNVEAIEDAAGDYWAIDINVRPMGTFMAWRQAGVPFEDGYLAKLFGWPDDRPTEIVPPGRTVDVFPQSSRAIALVSPTRAVRHFAHWAPRYSRFLGWRYVASAAIVLLGQIVRVWKARLTRATPVEPSA